MKKQIWAALSFVAFCSMGVMAAETAPMPSEPGIPVTDALVKKKCGGCHQADAQGNLTRISWIRTTPEGWEQAVKRMVRLNGLTLTPEEARQIVHYLATYHGLAPEEAKAVMYMAEHRMIDETVPPDMQGACNTCHAIGQPISWRRPKEEWDLLVKTHLGYFPVAEVTAFLRPPPSPDAEPKPNEDKRQPWEKAVDYLTKTYPLHTAEWDAYHSSIHPAKVEGRWLVKAYKPGTGPYYGEMTVTKGEADDEVVTSTKLVSSKDGSTIAYSGKAIVYAGFAWRGRSKSDSDPKELREVMMVARDGQTAEGRWMWGGYQEFGFEVSMKRALPGPVLLGLNMAKLKAGSTETVDLYGQNFPASAKPDSIDFGTGVKVLKILESKPGHVKAEVEVAKNAVPGLRDVEAFGSVVPSSVAVYDHIDFVKVAPSWALSHLGGTIGPKGLVQFEAIAYANGPDGKPNTPDDIILGPVQAKWSMQEFYATYGDDDTKFVGNLDSVSGLFTPAGEGPSMERQDMRNNYGDVWVVAEIEGPKGKPISGRSYLVVTVPQYLRFDQPEVAPNP